MRKMRFVNESRKDFVEKLVSSGKGEPVFLHRITYLCHGEEDCKCWKTRFMRWNRSRELKKEWRAWSGH